MFYAFFGMPIFLVWASKMGDLLANVFKVFYHNICCGLCLRGKRRKALALASKTRRQEMERLNKYDALGNNQQEVLERTSNFEAGSLDQDLGGIHKPSGQERGRGDPE